MLHIKNGKDEPDGFRGIVENVQKFEKWHQLASHNNRSPEWLEGNK